MAKTSEKLSRGRDELQRAKEDWSLAEDGDTFTAGNSLLQPVVFEGGAAMLKVPLTGKGQPGFRLLACWAGDGAAYVYRYSDTALLMERATGTRSLRAMVLAGREDEANTVICEVVRRLHKSDCRLLQGLIPLPEWFRSLGYAADRYGGLFRTCYEMAGELLADPREPVALHGDIHYDNILDSARGWIAIDPKGVAGERGFDFANIFCNPDLSTAASAGRLRKQVKLVAAAADVEASRLLRWIVAWSGLMAAWMLEDGEAPTLPVAVCELALAEYGND